MSTTALLFPGQGSHSEGMDVPFRDSPLLQRGLELLGYDPFERLAEGTRFQQPAVFLCSIAAWEADDSLPAAALVDERAAAMADAAALHPGSMTAMLGGDASAVAALAQRLGLVVANDNAPGQLVLAGPVATLEAAEECAREETGARARRLDVAGAFHSPLMEPAAERLAAALARATFATPRVPVYSNGSAAPFRDPRRELAENLLAPVRWRETLLALRATGVARFMELGPGEVLTGLVKRTLQVA
jgi:[acyl-carrier-protein] S-malonyltransferase